MICRWLGVWSYIQNVTLKSKGNLRMESCKPRMSTKNKTHAFVEHLHRHWSRDMHASCILWAKSRKAGNRLMFAAPTEHPLNERDGRARRSVSQVGLTDFFSDTSDFPDEAAIVRTVLSIIHRFLQGHAFLLQNLMGRMRFFHGRPHLQDIFWQFFHTKLWLLWFTAESLCIFAQHGHTTQEQVNYFFTLLELRGSIRIERRWDWSHLAYNLGYGVLTLPRAILSIQSAPRDLRIKLLIEQMCSSWG